MILIRVRKQKTVNTMSRSKISGFTRVYNKTEISAYCSMVSPTLPTIL